MGYIDRLSNSQKSNINTIIDAMENAGIKNKNTQAGVLSVISKESVFNPIAERGYGNTSNSRIRSIFSSRVADLSEDALTALKADRTKFFDKVYGGRYGNASNEGDKYRGRGFNQLTFKGNYQNVAGRIGVDLVNHPEKLEQPKIASKASVAYFTSAFSKGFTSSKQQAYNSKDIDGFKSLNDAVLAVYHSNAGFGKPIYTTSTKTSTGGLEKALQRAPEFLSYVKSYSSKKIV